MLQLVCILSSYLLSFFINRPTVSVFLYYFWCVHRMFSPWPLCVLLIDVYSISQPPFSTPPQDLCDSLTFVVAALTYFLLFVQLFWFLAPEASRIVSYCGSWLSSVVGTAHFTIVHFMYLFSTVTASFSVFCLTFRLFPRDIQLLVPSPQHALKTNHCFCCCH